MWWTVHLDGGPRRVNHAAAAVGERIYSFGGYCTDEDYNTPSPIDGYVLNTLTNRWSPIPQFDRSVRAGRFHPKGGWPYQRYGHTTCANGSLIYLFGGRSDTKISNGVHVFDTETLLWSKLETWGALPPRRDGHSACIIDNKMYIFGGYVEQVHRFGSSVYVLDLETRQWELVKTHGNPPSFRDFHTATAIGNHMFIFGGRCVNAMPGVWPVLQDEDNEFYSNTLTYLDIPSRTWVTPQLTSDRQPDGRRSHSAVNFEGNLLIFGGFNSKLGIHMNDMWLYHVDNHRWQEVKPRGCGPDPRRRQVMCLIEGAKKIFLFGGTSPYDGPPIKYEMGGQAEEIPEYSIDGSSGRRLVDHNDVYVLDLAPTLKTICCLQLAKNGITPDKLSQLEMPTNLRNELRYMITGNSISKPLETLYSG